MPLSCCPCRHHTATCAAIHINMCVVRPSFMNPLHLLQLANVALLPQLPVFLNSFELRCCQVGAGPVTVNAVHGQGLVWSGDASVLVVADSCECLRKV